MKPYSGLAEIYDDVMNHVNYRRWAEYIESIFNHFDASVNVVLETACGTGNLAVELHRRGYSMICGDISPEMLKIASAKFAHNLMPRHICAADMAALPFTGPFDAVICLYDSLNYLLDIATVTAAFSEAYRVLRPGGFFVFDVCTVQNSEMFFADHKMVERFGDIKCERLCHFNSSKRIQENHFNITVGDTLIRESHYQKIYWLHEIVSAYSGTGFREVGRFNDMSFSAGSEQSERVHFVLQK